MRKWIVMVSLVLFGLSGISYAQEYDYSRLQDAQDRLTELEMVDKRMLTKAEKKAWKREKRHLNRVIDRELDAIAFQQMAQNPWMYGTYYNPFWGPAFQTGTLFYGNPYRFRPNRYRRQAPIRRAPARGGRFCP